MLQSIKSLQQKFGDAATIHIFYSRYHKTQNSRKKLRLELENIHKFREHIYARKNSNIAINYGHLATDVGSFYWDLALANSQRPSEIDLLLSSIKKDKSPHPRDFTMDNLCIYSPKQLSEDAKFKHEMLIAWINLMLSEVPNCYFNITKALGFSKFAALLEGMVHKYFSPRNINVVYLMDALHSEIKKKHGDLYRKNQIFFQELFALYMKCLNTKCVEEGEKQRRFIERPLLDQQILY